jgi:arabinofuranosyltransferase
MQPGASTRTWRIVGSAALLAIVVRMAWLCDDAYITLRSVENLVAGHGPVWNVGERVQAFSHPAWFLLLALGRWLTGECCFTTLAIGGALAMFAAWRLLGVAGAAAPALAVVLCCSRAFTDFATGGLENPLTSALLVALTLAAWRDGDPDRRCARAAWLAGLATLTRMDLVVLAGPLLLAAAVGVPWRRLLRHAALGFAPFAAWTLFSAFYYGSPVPITAHAKLLAHGVPPFDVAVQGLHYFVACARHDLTTVLVIAAGIGLGFARPRLGAMPAAVGALLYCMYVVKVGGDFMTGRFLTPPFVVAAVIVARWLATAGRGAAWTAALAAVGALFAGGTPHWLLHPDGEPKPTTHHHFVADERLAYAPMLGLWAKGRSTPVPGLMSDFLRQQGLGHAVIPWGQVGRYGFEAGERIYVADAWLLDPLMMRLPIAQPGGWRIGHFERRPPEGYLESLATGEDRIRHPALRAYYATLRTALRAPLFAPERLRALWRLLTGADEPLLRSYVAEEYRTPPRLPVPAAALADELPIGTYWYREPRVQLVYPGGLAVQWPTPQVAPQLRVRVWGIKPYRFTFRRGDVALATVTLQPTRNWEFGLQEHTLDVPAAAHDGFDAVWIDGGMGADAVAAIGGLALAPLAQPPR